MRTPTLLRWLWTAWKGVGWGMGIVVSAVVLSVLWGVVFGLYAVGRRCAMVLKRPGKTETYWKPVPPDYPNSLDHGF